MCIRDMQTYNHRNGWPERSRICDCSGGTCTYMRPTNTTIKLQQKSLWHFHTVKILLPDSPGNCHVGWCVLLVNNQPEISTWHTYNHGNCWPYRSRICDCSGATCTYMRPTNTTIKLQQKSLWHFHTVKIHLPDSPRNCHVGWCVLLVNNPPENST